MLDTISGPAYIRNLKGDIVATNQLGRALFIDCYDADAVGFNIARYLFLDPGSRTFFVAWETVARDMVASLRIEAGRNPYDRGLTDLVGELSTRSEEFRTWWAGHQVKFHTTATKTLHHGVVGDLEVTGEALLLPGDPGLTLIVYTVEPNSASAQALALLGSWTAAHHPRLTHTAPLTHDTQGER